VGTLSPGLASPQVADGGEGRQIWRVAGNIFNKQSQIADRGRSSSLGVGRVANNPPSLKIQPVKKHIAEP
jgi:hypothetical protein